MNVDKVEAKIAAASVVVFEAGRFLLIERKYPPYQGWLSFPGGKVEAHETAEQAAARELYEETGLIATKLKFLRGFDLQQEGEASRPTLLNVYHAISIQGTPQAGDDAAAIFWCDIIEMQARQTIPSVLLVAKSMAY